MAKPRTNPAALPLLFTAVLLVIAGAVQDEKRAVHGQLAMSMAAVNATTSQVQTMFGAKSWKLTKRQKMGLKDCVEMFEEAMTELESVQFGLSSYDKEANSKVLSAHAADLRTWLSAAITNQEQCLDGLAEDGSASSLTEEIAGGVQNVSALCSDALAMVTRMTGTDVEEKLAKEKKSRKLLQAAEPDDAGFPEWMTEADRRMLQGAVAADVVVAADGSGNFEKISEAVAAAPSKSGKRYVIRIKAGTYKENVEVPKGKTNLMFVGDGIDVTVISGSRNVVDGYTTFRSATVAIMGAGFLARDLTIENTAGPSKHQAVALRVGSDLSAFYRCKFTGYQDTLYVYSQRQFYRECTISGTVDFIFGNAAVVFQSCNIQIRNPNSGQKNTVTAQGRTDPNQNTGISIQGCTISGSTSAKSYLGRPWKRFSRTIVMQSSISSVIDPAGWLPWSGRFALDTLTYLEYQNTGPGAATGNRVDWKGFQVISAESEAEPYTVGSFIGGASWLGDTGFPFSLGL
ncbi:pectinesterase-like [Wolffia australiana]